MRTTMLTLGVSLLLAGTTFADITLNFDSGWIAGGEYTDISNGNTVSGTLTGLVFDLEFDTVPPMYTAAGDGGLCFIPSGSTYGSYNIHCGGPNLGDFPPSWDNWGVPGNYTHYEDLSANPAVIVGDVLWWINGWSSSDDSRWHGTVTLEGLDWDLLDGQGACCYQSECTLYCENMYDWECEEYWGSIFYAGTPCDEIDCPPPPQFEGACCYMGSDGYEICEMTDELTCKELNGTWRGGIPCECIDYCDTAPPLGPCCVCTGCNIVTEASCDLFGGLWLGPGALCDNCPVPCPADVDNNGTVNVLDLLAVISDWGPCP